jgi:hypothetical protein
VTLKDRLRARGRPQVTYPILTATLPQVQAAGAELAEARDALARAQQAPAGHLLVERYEQAVAAAGAALTACYEHVTITALPPEDMEALIGEHPPTPAQAEDGATWDPVTFVPALLAASVSFGPDEPPWTSEEWAQETTATGALSLGEVTGLFQAALDVNSRSPDPRTGKG